MKRISLALLAVLLLLVVVLLVNNFRFKTKQLGWDGKANKYPLDTTALRHLAESIRFATVSYDDGHRDTAAFEGFLNFLPASFPAVFQNKNISVQGIGMSVLMKWKGTNENLKPILLYAHYDVVPIEEVNRKDWKHEPFGGELADGYLWGRGAIDDKVSVIAILEAMQRLMAQGFVPTRTIYVVFGHDEEIGGMDGAAVIAKMLFDQGVKTEMHLDEGGLVAHGIVPNMTKPVALIGTAEKGYMTLELTARLKGGHSSKPAKETAIGVLNNAILKLHNEPFPKQSPQAVSDFIQYVGPEMPQPLRTVFANVWLFRPVILKVYEGSAEGNAMIRTTGVPTVFHAGVKENLIPGAATATINFRILSGETSEAIKKRVSEIINDGRIEIKEMNNTFEPSRTTSTDSWSFKLVQQCCAEVYPDAVATPFLDIGSTDSKHFEKLGGDVLRFLPVRMDNDILGTFHGVNERIRPEDFMESIAFYEAVIKGSGR